MDVLYRLEGRPLFSGGELIVGIDKYLVIKKTQKGFWITRYPVSVDYRYYQHFGDKSKPRFVLDGVGKRFAYTTVEKAKESFIRRKTSYIGKLEFNLLVAKALLKWAKDPSFEINKPHVDETLKPLSIW